MATELVGNHDQVDDPLSTDAAAPGLLRHGKGGPTELCPSAPEVGLEAGLASGERADLAQRAMRFKELTGRLLEQFLVCAAFEHHSFDLLPLALPERPQRRPRSYNPKLWIAGLFEGAAYLPA